MALVLRRRAQSQPDRIAYIFLPDSGQEEIRMTYGELDLKARAIGARLQDLQAQGERVLLIFPSGLEYICAFYGCLYAGAVAVPAFPPDPNRIHRTLPRLQAIAKDSGAKVAITTQGILGLSELMLAHAPDLKTLNWLASDEISDDLAYGWEDPHIDGESLAFLQYTSGSTSVPKGVMINYDNLSHNAKAVYEIEGRPKNRVSVLWLPIYHDMGLMGGILQAMYSGSPDVFLPPFSFLKDPFRWLRAISAYRGTCTASPNFAYDLCVRKISEEQRKELDLHSWSVACNGAEPVRRNTIERFIEYFAPCGFRPKVMYPVYGLAEATLIASGGRRGRPPIIKFVNREELKNNRVTTETGVANKSLPLVGCGTALLDRKIRIVDPEFLEESPPDRVGEIWLAGPNNALGYWKRPKETKETFQAYLKNTGEGPFLRTGDLGFLDGEELFIAGRLKDLIIIGGQNHHPNDIELTVEKCHPAIRAGCGAAFSINMNEDERLVIAQEVNPSPNLDIQEVVSAIRRAVAEYHELMVSDVVLIEPKTIFKTSSGKIQRHACRKAFLDGTLDRIGKIDEVKIIRNEAM
jgi:acyl-CoA synthetase (AMP-forming)/AMP-acid ligase II